MISIENCTRYESCNCCYSKKDIKRIKLMNKWSGMVIVLCRDCRNELFQKMREENNEETV